MPSSPHSHCPRRWICGQPLPSPGGCLWREGLQDQGLVLGRGLLAAAKGRRPPGWLSPHSSEKRCTRISRGLLGRPPLGAYPEGPTARLDLMETPASPWEFAVIPIYQERGAQSHATEDSAPRPRTAVSLACRLLPVSGLSSCLASRAPAASSPSSRFCTLGGSGPWACSMAHSFSLMASSSCQHMAQAEPRGGTAPRLPWSKDRGDGPACPQDMLGLPGGAREAVRTRACRKPLFDTPTHRGLSSLCVAGVPTPSSRRGTVAF